MGISIAICETDSDASMCKVNKTTFVKVYLGNVSGYEDYAEADLVIEGFVDPAAPLVREGPFGDHTGYYSLADDYPVLEVTRITRRGDAVYPATVVGPPPMEDLWLGQATERLFLPLLQTVFPEVVDMSFPAEGVFHNLCFIALRKEYPGHAKKLMHGLWGSGQMANTKTLVVFDEDVDVQDHSQCAWRALAFVDTAGDVGQYTSIAIGVDGLPVISYHHMDGALVTVHCSNRFCIPNFRQR